MKEKIERLSKGIFEYEVPSLIVSETSLDIVVEAGIRKEGTIRIANEAGQRMKGVLYVTGKILVLNRTDFIGTECEVEYLIDASILQPGEEHIGTINIVSDCGECQIPYRVCVAEPSFPSSVGMLKDLFQFANLARVSWKEALELFGREDFSEVVLQKEPRYHLAHEQLRQSPDLSQAMEEFLVLVHKKKASDFYIEVDSIELEAGTERFLESLTIKKEQWGYLSLKVHTEAEYLSLTKTEFLSFRSQATIWVSPVKSHIATGGTILHLAIRTYISTALCIEPCVSFRSFCIAFIDTPSPKSTRNS